MLTRGAGAAAAAAVYVAAALTTRHAPFLLRTHATFSAAFLLPEFYLCALPQQDIGKLPLGVKALATHPLKSSKRDPGLRGVPLSFGGVTIKPGDYIYADADGILVSDKPL